MFSSSEIGSKTASKAASSFLTPIFAKVLSLAGISLVISSMVSITLFNATSSAINSSAGFIKSATLASSSAISIAVLVDSKGNTSSDAIPRIPSPSISFVNSVSNILSDAAIALNGKFLFIYAASGTPDSGL